MPRVNPFASMSPPKGSVLDMDERRSSGETDTTPLRLLFLSAKIHKKPVDFQSLILYTIKHDIYRVFLEVNVENTIPEAIPTMEALVKLEDTDCLEIIKATLTKEYAKQENERDEALLDEAWATFTEITGIKTSFSFEEIDKRVKAIIEESRA